MKKVLAVPIMSFESIAAWEDWLAHNHASSRGIWMKLPRKGGGKTGITYDEALDGALCHGWIDGQKQSHDAATWLQKFSPRQARSIWSKRNRDHVARLIKDGRMKASGLTAVAAAQKDGRWDRAYDSPRTMAIPEEFMNELGRSKKALAFFETLNKANRYAIAWRLQTATRPETRERRKAMLLDMLRQGKKLH